MEIVNILLMLLSGFILFGIFFFFTEKGEKILWLSSSLSV